MASKIGERMKSLRKAAGVTRNKPADAASADSDSAEMIETTDQIPPVTLMTRLCNALGVKGGTAPDGSETAWPVIGRRPANVKHEEDNLRYYMLADKKSDRSMEPRIIEVGYIVEGDRTSVPHEGEEFLYVIEGEVNLKYGKEKYTLAKGDSIYYDSIVPHLLSSIKEGVKAKVLSITYMPAY